MNAQILLALLSAALTLIDVPFLLYGAKYYWDRRRWRIFEALIRSWADKEFGPEDLTEQDWKALAAVKLTDAGFEPMKIKELIELAGWFAKGHASLVAFERIGFRDEEESNGDSAAPQ